MDSSQLGGHPRMPLSERAKIFQPFNPLTGFSEALAAKEREVEAAALEGDGVSGERPADPDAVFAPDCPSAAFVPDAPVAPSGMDAACAPGDPHATALEID